MIFIEQKSLHPKSGDVLVFKAVIMLLARSFNCMIIDQQNQAHQRAVMITWRYAKLWI